MPRKEAYAPGTFCYVDLAAHDHEAAIAFYRELFGWQVARQDTGDGPPYALFTQQGSVVGGIGEMSDRMRAKGIPPVWNSYVSVEDADAAAARAAELDGRVLSAPQQVMEAARIAFVNDPAGASFALWQPLGAIGAQRVDEPTSLCWNELATPDLEEARTFYGELFGWRFADMGARAPGDALEIQHRGLGNGHIVQMNNTSQQVAPHWAVYFAVFDTGAACARCRGMGGAVLVEPFDLPAGRAAVCADPQGAHFYVIALG